MGRFDAVIAHGRDDLDLTDPAVQPAVRGLAEELLTLVEDEDPTAATDLLRTLGRSTEVPIDVRIATKLAESRRRLRAVGEIEVAVQFAMWGEHRRLRPRDQGNPLGEDALGVKLDQLDWLLDGSTVRWRLVAIDDGCPDGSADVAEEMAAGHRMGDRVQVLRLADVVPATDGPLSGLADVDDSRKGGAMVYGASVAVDGGADAVVLTDADVSVDLGQLGLLLGPFADGAGVVIGDRKQPDSVLRKAEARWGPGIVVLRHMQRMVGRALFSRGIADTQAAFKLYGAAALSEVLAAPSTFGFSFDSDWLYAAIGGGHEVATTPFAFVDSFEESASITQGPMTTWESLLVGLTQSARARGADHDAGMAALVDEFGRAAVLEQVITRVPEALADVEPTNLGDPAVMSPAELGAWLRAVTS
ncbi:glycosyltransferase [Euzebya tangerina]|uniref:glycosyltransferase n=1 Tax=Euzebya tangerina TaxID=591198 RepID=UPI000E32231F|nr:glycosyltransferase [Euzebya tangerina]